MILIFDWDFLLVKSRLNFWDVRFIYPFSFDFYYDIMKIVVSILELIYYIFLKDYLDELADILLLVGRLNNFA